MIRRSVTTMMIVMTAAAVATAQAPAELDFGGREMIVARAVASHITVAPGETFYLAVDMSVPDHWVYYSPAPGPVVIAASLKVTASGLTAGEILWPKDKVKITDVMTNNVYTGRTIAYVPLTAGGAEGKIDITVSVEGQICKDTGLCVNVEGVTASAAVTVGARSRPNPAWSADETISAGLADAVPAGRLRGGGGAGAAFVGLDYGLAAGLGLALLAGLILNVMPCVLPVIPLKVMSILQMARESRRRFVTLGLSFAGGIMIFFAALAAVNVILWATRSTGINWGEQFQSRAIIIVMALVVIALAMNLFGAFHVIVPSRIMAAGAEVSSKGESHLSAVGMGVFTGILATPCSFAILGAAFMWAQGRSLLVGTAAIMLIGVGMAAPYALLVMFPNLVSRLPRPGRWMELLKQSMGFPLVLVALFLVSSLAEDTYAFWVLGYAVVLSFALWMWGSWLRYDAAAWAKWTVRSIALALAVGGGAWMLRPATPLAVEFEPFDAARIASARRQGRTVLIDFTAKWCLTCKTVEAIVYTDPAVGRKVRELNVLAIYGDVTTKSLPAAAMLYGDLKEKGVPVTVIFPPDGPPVRLRGIFSVAELLDALDAAAAVKP